MEESPWLDPRLLPVYQALGRRDLVALQHQVSTDVVLHVDGSSSFAGTYEGIGQVLGLAGRLENRIVQGASQLESMEPDGDRVKATVRVTLRSAWGEMSPRLFESFRFDPNDRICEIWVWAEDQAALDRFLDRLGRPV
jgi:hypothetical protein